MSDLESARHDAIRALCRAQVDDRLSVEAFESRLARVQEAPNRATIDAIVADLEDTTHLPARITTDEYQVQQADHLATAPVAPAEFLRIASIFSSGKRGGAWTVPLHLEVYVLFGEVTLDLRDAVFASDVVDIDVSVTIGSFTLIVPPGTQIENEIEETLADTSHKTRTAGGANLSGLLIRLRGRALLASVELKERGRSGQRELRTGWRRLIGKWQ